MGQTDCDGRTGEDSSTRIPTTKIDREDEESGELCDHDMGAGRNDMISS